MSLMTRVMRDMSHDSWDMTHWESRLMTRVSHDTCDKSWLKSLMTRVSHDTWVMTHWESRLMICHSVHQYDRLICVMSLHVVDGWLMARVMSLACCHESASWGGYRDLARLLGKSWWQKNWGAIRGKILHENREIVGVWTFGLWVHRDSWLRAQVCPILEPNTNAQIFILLSHVLRSRVYTCVQDYYSFPRSC